jgi:hypothetical protein
VHWWKFAECSGTRIGDSRGGLIGKLIVGSAGTQNIAGDCASSSASSARYNGREGMFSGKAIDFDGTDDYASTSNFSWPDNSQMSISFWIKPTVLATGKPIISQWGGSANTFMAKTDDSDSSKLVICITSSGGSSCTSNGQTPTGILTNGTWKHVIAVYNSSGSTNADRLKIYIDGIEKILTFQSTIPAALQTLSGASLKFGGNPSLPGYANVKIDEIKVWNYALDDFAIKADYNGGEVRFGE